MQIENCLSIVLFILLSAILSPKTLPPYFHKSQFSDCVCLWCIYSRNHCLVLQQHLRQQHVPCTAPAWLDKPWILTFTTWPWSLSSRTTTFSPAVTMAYFWVNELTAFILLKRLVFVLKSVCFFSFFKIYLLIMLLQLSHFPPLTPLHPAHPLPPKFPPYSSCPWVILISSLASTFPTLFLPSP